MRASTIRRRYPYPRASDCVGAPGRYCVGGALLKYMGWSDALSCYPSEPELARWLSRANRKLSMCGAQVYARRIIKHNDVEDYTTAWKVLDEALTYNDK